MEHMEFYPVEQADLIKCVGLFVSVFNNAPWNENWEVEAVTERLDDCYRTPGFYGLIAKIDGEVSGFAVGTIGKWDNIKLFTLSEMCIVTGKQRNGVGTALLNDLEEKLKHQGVAKIYLTTARDTPAQNFYEKNGFYVSPKMILMTKWLESR